MSGWTETALVNGSHPEVPAMVDITLDDGTHFAAQRVFQVLSANDPEGEKTYFVAQIDGARRRLDHTRVVSAFVRAEEPLDG